MDSLLGYGSDSGGEEQEAQVPAPKKGLLGSLPVVKSGGGLGGLPPAKKQRRTLEIGKMMKTPTKGSDSDDDTPAIVSKAKASSGLLSFLPRPKNEAPSTTAYDDAVARMESKKGHSEEGKKMSKAQMASALFEKQRQEKIAAQKAESEDAGVHAGADEGPADASQQRQVIDPNWAAAWDDSFHAYYYYHTISGETQWEPPFGFDTATLEQAQNNQLPEDLQRELAQQEKRAGKRGEFIPDLSKLSSAKAVIGEKLMSEGEKHVQYRSAAAAFHQPMNTVKGKPTQLERRKHQLTDVLHMAATHELEFLDKNAEGRKSSAAVRNRYGW